MKQSILTWKEFYKGTIRHDRTNLSFVNLTNFRNCNNTFNYSECIFDTLFISTSNLDLTNVSFLFDRNLSSCLLLNTLDNLSARAYHSTNELFRNSHGFNARSMIFEF